MVADLVRAVGDPELLREVDLDQLDKLPADYVGDSGQQRRGDTVWRVSYRGGSLYLLILLEFQSKSDSLMALRNLEYTTLLYRELERRAELGTPGAWPPVLPVVLYNGETRWTAELEMRELIAPVPGACHQARCLGAHPRCRRRIALHGGITDRPFVSARGTGVRHRGSTSAAPRLAGSRRTVLRGVLAEGAPREASARRIAACADTPQGHRANPCARNARSRVHGQASRSDRTRSRPTAG